MCTVFKRPRLNMLSGLSCVYEPNFIHYSVDGSRMERAAEELEKIPSSKFRDKSLVRRCTEKRVLRTNIFSDSVKLTVSAGRLIVC